LKNHIKIIRRKSKK